MPFAVFRCTVVSQSGGVGIGSGCQGLRGGRRRGADAALDAFSVLLGLRNQFCLRNQHGPVSLTLT